VRRDWIVVTVLWSVLTVIGELAIFTWSMVPEGYAREAEVVNDAFLLLLAFSVPVAAFVMTMVGYSVVMFRSKGEPTEDGPPMKGEPAVITAWLIITTLLVFTVLVNPGFVGLSDIRGDADADVVIGIQSQRWTWEATYENGVVSGDELVLPVDTRIRFDITATDVLHSFWIPAFAVKIDAVPGRTTELLVTPERLGDADSDPNVRVQCAELCGSGHAAMSMPVRIVEQDEYEQWLDGLLEAAAGEGS